MATFSVAVMVDWDGPGEGHRNPSEALKPLPVGLNLAMRKIMKQFPPGVEATGCEAWRFLVALFPNA